MRPLFGNDPPAPSATRVLRPERAAPADSVRPTRAEVSLGNLRHNLRLLQKASRAPVWAVLKADGYGHGAKAMARTLERAGVAGLCVALLEEAVELRDAGIVAPILVMGADYGKAWDEVLDHDLTPVLHRLEQIADFAAEVRYRGGPAARAHLKIDTGMGRLGVGPVEIARAGDELRRNPEIELEGLMTHFASADSDPDSVREQLRRFDEQTRKLEAAGVQASLRHAANSAALLSEPATHLDLVRPGLALMGYSPVDTLALPLRPVMRVRSAVFSLRDLEVGQSAGYGSTWTATRPSRIATIPMGYADGLSRAASNRGAVLIRGQRAPIVGTISMDLTTVDVTDIPGVTLRDEVVVLGSQTGPLGTDQITATELASQQGTISWEILTNISRRVPRFYLEA